jgi:hypothetical protein
MSASIRRNCLDAAIVALITFLFAAAALPAFADTYELTTVAYSRTASFYGIDASGDYTVNLTSTMGHSSNPTCGTIQHASSCFATYYVGQSAPVYSTTPPSLTWDNGSACSPTLSNGTDGQNGVCNNGHELFSASGNNSFPGVFTGSDPSTDYLTAGTISGALMNSSGDAVFVDNITGTLLCVLNIPALDSITLNSSDPSNAPVPEPGSLCLFGTGCLTLVGAARRKFRR